VNGDGCERLITIPRRRQVAYNGHIHLHRLQQKTLRLDAHSLPSNYLRSGDRIHVGTSQHMFTTATMILIIGLDLGLGFEVLFSWPLKSWP